MTLLLKYFGECTIRVTVLLEGIDKTGRGARTGNCLVKPGIGRLHVFCQNNEAGFKVSVK